MRDFKTKVLTTEFEKKARLMKLAGEPARIRILCVLLAEPGACVSRIAGELNMSVAAVSHHLQLMHAGGLVSAKRRGKQVCYSMPIGKNLKYLRQFICQKE